MPSDYTPEMTRAGRAPTHAVVAIDQSGQPQRVNIAGEFPLTLVVDGQDVVTLMTLGTHPEELVLGYLRNQGLISDINDIRSVRIDWDKETAVAETTGGIDLTEKLSHKIVTSGCGQGTLFSCTIDALYELRLPRHSRLRQSTIYALLNNLRAYNQIYRQAGAVHGCALCQGSRVLIFVEDVGRHNATDAISGRMWLDRIAGDDMILYTTGRLTSEIVMKSARMGIPVLLSRSGITHMGLELAQDLGLTMIARAKRSRFLIYNGHENIDFDVAPPIE